ncbi:MAG TPA: methyltransferase domain-containing protein [Candidatus Angelobacter sp.]
MKPLQELQRNWEGLAQADPMWAICSDPNKKNQQWDRDAFFASGKSEVAVVLAYVAQAGLTIDSNSPVLDFGCGVGRLTQALAPHFAECWGMDISPTMVKLAQGFAGNLSACRFMLNEGEQLGGLRDNYFGFIYTSIVLQHIAKPYSLKYIAELIRVLMTGGVLIFQVPDKLRLSPIKKLRARLALRSRLESFLGKQKPFTMEMHCVPEAEIRKLVDQSGGRVMDVRLTNSTEPSFSGNLQYLEREPDKGYVSKQYCVVKAS